MLVYRVQDDRGLGPYRFDSPVQDILVDRHNNPNHPAPEEDNIYSDQYDEYYYFGFQSMELLEEWFDGCFDLLREHKYKIGLFDCDFVRVGYTQVAFLKEASVLLEVIELC